jgi:GNAT superfamily N-acetyltransferase
MTVFSLEENDISELTTVLVSAFHDYEVMQYMFSDTGQGYETLVGEYLSLICAASVANRWPCLHIREEDKLVAVLAARGVGNVDWPPTIEQKLKKLFDKAEPGTAERIERYEQEALLIQAEEAHIHVEVLGVDVEYQGKGYAGELLRAVQQLSILDKNSQGVGLNTGSSGNLPFYEHLGYQIVGETRIDNLHSWSLFRPD